MADFYESMRGVANELLAPTSQNGLGQGVITLTRTTPGEPDEDEPWLPVEPDKQTEVLDGAVKGVDSRIVGTEVGSAVILPSDRESICTVPDMGYQAGDVLKVDGKTVTVISAENIPAAGVVCAVKFIIRG